jgi:hypothetical protein
VNTCRSSLVALTSVALVALASLAAPAVAREVAWDGRTYLPIALRPGADTRLTMPEEFDDAWEHDDEVAVTPLDPTTLIIRPRVPVIEQRLTLRGRRTGTIYLARVSTALPYAPLVVVRNAALVQQAATQISATTTVVGLLRALMRGTAPAGFRVERSERLLLDQPPYRIRARSLWRSPRLSGIVADIESTLPGRSVPVIPGNLVLRAPELGQLRAAAPERFELDATTPSTPLYLVFTP